ncbi:aldehyde ferredoxin oxidoreductase C-terminal domain-containing protein [Thermodesulfobacteriota bacterium]
MSKIIRINMKALAVSSQETPPEFVQLGGRGLSSHIIATEVPPTCHPLSAANKLIAAPGLLAGTAAPNSGRLSIGAKSPLTEGIKEANVGGTVGHKLGRLGIKAIVLEGKPADNNLYVVKVDKEGASIIAAPELAGLGNYDATAKLQETYGDKISIICIGPAGEMRLAGASVATTDPEGRPARHAARGGLGAVMGSKGVKAIVIDDSDTKALEAQDKETFRTICREFTKEIVERKATKLISQFGTVGGLPFISKLGSLPTRNYQAGSFEGGDKIGGKGIAEMNAARGGGFGHICMPGCVVRCSNVMHDKEGKFLTAGFEYESSAMLGANLGIDDIDAVLALEKKCDNLGLDTMETGSALGIAADAGLWSFGDGKRALELLQEIEDGTVLGRVLGQGTQVTARVFGISRVPVVKGQAIPAHDPRKELGSGIGYATSPQGADHTGIMQLMNADTAEMIEISRHKQIETCVVDSVGMCQMAEASLEVMAGLVSSFYGWNWSMDDITALGSTILKEEVAFNRKAGLGPETDRLPDFLRDEKLGPHEGIFDIPEKDFEKVLEL